MKTIVLYIATVHIAVLLTQPVFGQKNKKNDWYEENLKGKVVQITLKTYYANLKFGEIAKGDCKEESKVWFNENGFIIRQQDTDAEGTTLRIYDYDVQGDLCRAMTIKLTSSTTDGITVQKRDTTAITTYEYIYDANGRLKEQNDYDADGNLTKKSKHSYLQGTHTVTSYDGNGELTSHVIITDGGRKRVTPSIKGAKLESTFDDRGRLITLFTSFSNTQYQRWGKKLYYKYNSQGDLASITTCAEYADGAQGNQLTEYKYEYDKQGNWIVREEYEQSAYRGSTIIEDPLEITIDERVIVYANSDQDFQATIKQEEQEERKNEERIALLQRRADSIQLVQDSIQKVNQENIRKHEYFNSGGASLAGRSLQAALPRPDYGAREEGRVVIEIMVDRQGRVTDATYRSSGSTTQNSTLINAALRAARQARFNEDENAAISQRGTITYSFRMQ
mgnify:CR=1 FL=1